MSVFVVEVSLLYGTFLSLSKRNKQQEAFWESNPILADFTREVTLVYGS
jgi:hypothetical protein